MLDHLNTTQRGVCISLTNTTQWGVLTPMHAVSRPVSVFPKILAVVLCVFSLGLLGFLDGYRSINGRFRGICENITYNVQADLVLELREGDGNMLSGSLIIGPPLDGGGELIWATRDGKRVKFTTMFPGGKIIWIGTIDGKNIGGEYFVEPDTGLGAMFGPRVEKQQGRWLVRRQ